MTPQSLRDLAILTLKTPSEAALTVMAAGLPARFLWLALSLMAVLNALIYAVAMVIRPPLEGEVIFLPSPMIYFAIVAVGLYALVWSLYLVGRWMGGAGALRDLLALVVWMQALRVVAQAAIMVLSMISASLSMIGSMAIFVLGIWIGLHFVNQGHRLGSLGRAAGVLIAAGLATLMGVSLVLSLVAAPFVGATTNV